MPLFDSHAHWDDPKFDDCRDSLLQSDFAGGVGMILNAAASLATSEKSIALAQAYPGIYASVGIHPEECGDENTIDSVMRTLAGMLRHDKVVAIGECGLDYHYETNPPRETQKKWFDAQLSLATETGYPVIVHDREAHGDCFDAIMRYPKAYGVFHSYSGSAEMALELVKRGWYISFSGVLTFKNAAKLPEVLAKLPSDRILIETDCPYLAPEPYRGKTNHSLLVRYTCERLADIRGITFDEAVALTERNALRLYRIPATE